MSHSYLIGLLEQGKIAYTLVGAHRWISVDEVSVYREKMINNSRAAMDELMKFSQELGM